ncbi:archaeal proteasome endopeptidase complex subunit alpha [Halorussus limi]|uniref:Proteasome subunit alpha n=1 Tax=Halorussus limi TaxID=2938695 RepID=A0A8U0HV24_9EURY|nr:archaeal proteasome endopeptidase complex subunit alpha [Halorussus limi]UPV74767.1 archaeal proteasome endopeptidase complex subunit alpha [Halorussus limi]
MEGDQRAYDRGTSIFSPDGRLYQVEYAREAVERGSASVGVETAEGVVLAARRRVRSPLMDPESVEKLHQVDGHLGVASAGNAADARQLVEFARQTAQRDRLTYDEPMGVEPLAKEIADHVQEYTQSGGARPFGTALLVGGVADGRPALYETDPSGTPSAWKAAAVGRESAVIREFLEAEYRSDADLDASVDLALDALAAPDDASFSPADVAVATVTAESGYRRLPTDERRNALDSLGLLDESGSPQAS